MTTGFRDPDLLILEQLDDRSLLSLCSVDKYTNTLCKNEDFWNKRFIKTYGNYIKPTLTKWRELYLKVVYYLDGSTDWNIGMEFAAKKGDKDLVDFFISKGANYWNKGMLCAVQGGHKDLVEFFISKGSDDWNWNWGMYGAAKRGHQDLVDFFISKGADNWNSGMYGAAKRGHQDLVDFFISKGADNWNWGMVHPKKDIKN